MVVEAEARLVGMIDATDVNRDRTIISFLKKNLFLRRVVGVELLGGELEAGEREGWRAF